MKAIVCQLAFQVETDKAMAALREAINSDSLQFEYRKGKLSALITALEILEFSLSAKQLEKSEIPSKLKQAKFCIVQCMKSRKEKLENN